MGLVGEDERWKAFEPLHDYLVQSFPLTYVMVKSSVELLSCSFMPLPLHQARESDADEGQHIRIALRMEGLR